jgi:hypothetical protein
VFRGQVDLRIDLDETFSVHQHVVAIIKDDEALNWVRNRLQPVLDFKAPFPSETWGLAQHAAGQNTIPFQELGVLSHSPVLAQLLVITM